VSIPVAVMADFLNGYDSMKPFEREELQKVATQSLEHFKEALRTMKRNTMHKSIYR